MFPSTTVSGAKRMSLRRLTLKPLAHIQRALRRFRDKTEGVAAVEFALILPIMVTMMMGAIELSEAVTVDRRVSMVAATAGDLLARKSDDMPIAELKQINEVGGALMEPYPTTPAGGLTNRLTINLAVVAVPCPTSAKPCASGTPAKNNPNIKPKWSCRYNSDQSTLQNCTCAASGDAAVEMPGDNLIAYDDPVVVADVAYDYSPIVKDWFMKNSGVGAGLNGSFRLKEKLVLKPRGACIKLVINGSTTCGC